MIVITIDLVSAVTVDNDQNLGVLVIDNIGGTHKKGNYRCRMYRKGALKKAGGDSRIMVRNAIHTRSATVEGHNRISEPVQNLVAKALTALGYK